LQCQLAEYRERTKAKEKEGSSATVRSAPAPTRENLPLVFQLLSEQYGLGAEMQFASPGGLNEQPVEQEYQAYVTAPLLPHRTNTLKFWEVRDN
jgi:hypothetical protein